MRKILIVAAMVIFATAAYLMTDEQLSPLAAELSNVEFPNNSNVSRAYRILLGIHAAEQDDAFEVGSERISQYLEAAGDAGTLDEVLFSDYPAERSAYIPTYDDHPLYCYNGDPGCLDEVVDDSVGRRVELDRLDYLDERYRTYLTAGDFHTELSPAMNEPWPEYRYLVVANRMRIFTAYDVASRGDSTTAIENLLGDIRELRPMLAKSDNVVHKVVTAAMIRDSLDAVAHLHNKYDELPFPPIPHLSADEHSFRKALSHEFRMLSPVVFSPLENEELWSAEFGSVPRVFQKLYHPNKIVNVLASTFDREIRLSELSTAKFAESVRSSQDHDSQFFSIIPSIDAKAKKYLENDYVKYIGRVFDLDVKIALVNSRIARDGDPLENPYYPGKSAIVFDDDDRTCLNGPLTDPKYTRCLPFAVDSEVALAN